MSQRMYRIIGDMPLNSPDRLEDAALVTSILQGVMAGLGRKLLESAEPVRQFETFRRELVRTATACLEQCPRLTDCARPHAALP